MGQDRHIDGLHSTLPTHVYIYEYGLGTDEGFNWIPQTRQKRNVPEDVDVAIVAKCELCQQFYGKLPT